MMWENVSFSFPMWVVHTPDDSMINWICQPSRRHAQLHCMVSWKQFRLGSWNTVSFYDYAIYLLFGLGLGLGPSSLLSKMREIMLDELKMLLWL